MRSGEHLGWKYGGFRGNLRSPFGIHAKISLARAEARNPGNLGRGDNGVGERIGHEAGHEAPFADGVVFDAAMHVRPCALWIRPWQPHGPRPQARSVARTRRSGHRVRLPYLWRGNRLFARPGGILDCFGEPLIPKRKMSTAEITAFSTCLLSGAQVRPSNMRR